MRYSLSHDGTLTVTVADQATGRKVQTDLGFRGGVPEGALRRRGIAGLGDHLPRPALLGGDSRVVRNPLALVFLAILLAVATLPVATHQASAVPPEASPTDTAIDFLLVLDVSASMRGLSGQDLFGLVEAIQGGNRLGIVCFSRDAELVLPLGPIVSEEDRTRAMAVLEGVLFDGSHTDLTIGLREALDYLVEQGASSRKHLVFLSDGRMDAPPGRGTASTLLDELRETVLPGLRAHGVAVHSVAYGTANISLMREVAGFTGGFCLVSPGPETLGDAFLLLADHLQPLPTPVSTPSWPSWLIPLLVAAVAGWCLAALLAVRLRRGAKAARKRGPTVREDEPVRIGGGERANREAAAAAYAGWKRIDFRSRSSVAMVMKLYDLVEDITIAAGHDSFDDKIHRAVGSRPGGPTGTVLEVRQRGLLFRPREDMEPFVFEKAQVIVSSG